MTYMKAQSMKFLSTKISLFKVSASNGISFTWNPLRKFPDQLSIDIGLDSPRSVFFIAFVPFMEVENSPRAVSPSQKTSPSALPT